MSFFNLVNAALNARSPKVEVMIAVKIIKIRDIAALITKFTNTF
jgi:hypothetical protein